MDIYAIDMILGPIRQLLNSNSVDKAASEVRKVLNLARAKYQDQYESIVKGINDAIAAAATANPFIRDKMSSVVRQMTEKKKEARQRLDLVENQVQQAEEDLYTARNDNSLWGIAGDSALTRAQNTAENLGKLVENKI